MRAAGGYFRGWSRLKPQIHTPHSFIIILSVPILLLSLLLAGCSSSSPLIPSIFLISLYYQKYTAIPSTAQVDYNAHNAIAVISGDAILQCRIGYFGICISPDGGSWLCSNNATALANEISLNQDPLNLIWLASQFKDMIVFPYLIILAIIFLFICAMLFATFPYEIMEDLQTATEEGKNPFPVRSVVQVILCITFIATVFVLVSVLWQHTASVAASIIAKDFGNGSIRSGVGTTAMVLGWFGFIILIFTTLAILFLHLSFTMPAGDFVS